MSKTPSIDEIYRLHITMVRGRARRLLRNEAEADDVAQETFIRAMKFLKKKPKLESMGALLYTTVTRLSLNRIRDKKRRRELLNEHGTMLVPQALPSESEQILTLQALFALVPEEVALIATYHFVDGMNHAEIALLLKMERRTISRRIEKFRELSKRYCEVAA